MIEAIIFDKDGVLVDSEKGKCEAMRKALQALQIPVPEDFEEWYFSRIGVGGLESNEDFIRDFKIRNVEPRTLYDTTEEIRRKSIGSEPPPIIQQNIEFLKEMSKKGYKIGVASSDFPENIKIHLRQAGALKYVHAMTSGEKHSGDVTHEKPHPEVYLVTAKKLGVSPERCAGIEDTAVGVQAVKSAGMYCIAYRNQNSGNQDLSSADTITNDLKSINFKSLT